MVESRNTLLDFGFAALADPTRRAIVRRLLKGEATVSELAAPHDMTLWAVSKHLAVLEDARIVERRRDGRSQRCRLVPRGLDATSRWLDDTRASWEAAMDRMARAAEADR